AAAMRGQKYSTFVKQTYGGGKGGQGAEGPVCFSCGKTGHIRKDCKDEKGSKRAPPGLCPRCKKGYHWKSECKSKFDKDGNPLPPLETNAENSKNLVKGQSPSPAQKGDGVKGSGLNPEAPPFTIHDLPRGTPGSAGLDLSSQKDLILSLEDGVSLVPTLVKGTLPEGTTGLIIGRSSNYKKGLEVLPGVIDSDFQGEIKVMVKAAKNAVIIHKGERIAQLLLLPYLKLPNPVIKEERGSEGFGSTSHVH
nr:p14 NC [Mouse mammary tumor virus]